jgi:hypothetical protein
LLQSALDKPPLVERPAVAVFLAGDALDAEASAHLAGWQVVRVCDDDEPVDRRQCVRERLAEEVGVPDADAHGLDLHGTRPRF